jgi:hypothetical protein
VPIPKVAALCYDKIYRTDTKKTEGNLTNTTFGVAVLVSFDFVLLYCCKNKCVYQCVPPFFKKKLLFLCLFLLGP